MFGYVYACCSAGSEVVAAALWFLAWQSESLVLAVSSEKRVQIGHH